MKKINFMDFAKECDTKKEIAMIKELYDFMKTKYNIKVPSTEIIDKNFVYEFKKSLKEFDKKILGKNRYVFLNRNLFWDFIDLYVDFQYSECKQDVKFNADRNITMCQVLMFHCLDICY